MAAPIEARGLGVWRSGIGGIGNPVGNVDGYGESNSVPLQALAMTTNAKSDIAALPFEKALAELEQIVRKLEQGEVALEESIALYERGELLKKRCEALLAAAEARIEKITLGADGSAKGAEPFPQG